MLLLGQSQTDNLMSQVWQKYTAKTNPPKTSLSSNRLGRQMMTKGSVMQDLQMKCGNKKTPNLFKFMY